MRKIIFLASLFIVFSHNLYGQEENVAFTSKKVSDPLLSPDPNSKIWKNVKGATIELMPQQITTPSLDKAATAKLTVKSVNNGNTIAFLIEWSDKTKNDALRIDKFRDAVAIELPLTSEKDKLPSPFMGNQGGRVHIAQWKADWQRDVDKGFVTTKALYPNLWSDHYPPDINKSLEEHYVAGKSAGNIISNDIRKNPVESLMAEGFGTLTTQKNQTAYGKGVWSNGKWRVVIALPMTATSKTEATIAPHAADEIAFAVWDGENMERGSLKAFSNWTEFEVE